MTITEDENTIQFSQAGWTHLGKSNYNEADSRITFYDANSGFQKILMYFFVSLRQFESLRVLYILFLPRW